MIENNEYVGGLAISAKTYKAESELFILKYKIFDSLSFLETISASYRTTWKSPSNDWFPARIWLPSVSRKIFRKLEKFKRIKGRLISQKLHKVWLPSFSRKILGGWRSIDPLHQACCDYRSIEVSCCLVSPLTTKRDWLTESLLSKHPRRRKRETRTCDRRNTVAAANR